MHHTCKFISNILSQIKETISHLKLRSSHVCLTIDGEVYSVFSIPCRECGVFADVGGLVREAERGEGDGGVFKRRSSASHCCVLEGNAVPVGRGHRHTQGGVGDRHILLSAVHQFLPRYLGREGWMEMETVIDGKWEETLWPKPQTN